MADSVSIKVLGTGCPNCKRVEAITREVTTDLGVDATIEKVTDVRAIVGYGIMSTPGLVVEGKVVSAGRSRPRPRWPPGSRRPSPPGKARGPGRGGRELPGALHSRERL